MASRADRVDDVSFLGTAAGTSLPLEFGRGVWAVVPPRETKMVVRFSVYPSYGKCTVGTLR